MSIIQKIQVRRDTSANWTSNNPTLAQGEFGFETDTGKLKVGDGASAWNSLAYFAGLTDLIQDTTPELGGELDCGEHTIGFSEKDNGNSGAAKTIDWKLSNKQKIVLSDNCVFTFTAPTNPCSITLKLVQDAAGSRTATWPASVKWPSATAPTLSTAANAIDIISFYYDGTNYYGVASLNFS